MTAAPLSCTPGAVSPTLATLLEGHRLWVERQPGGARVNLCQWKLPGIDLTQAVLEGAVLRDIDLSGACLRGVNMARADLRFASLKGADARDADFSGALLDSASLAGANLGNARFLEASLMETKLDGIVMSWSDHTLLAERLTRAAGDNMEWRMLAAYIGRMKCYCWMDYKGLTGRQLRWIMTQCCRWRQPGDQAPPVLEVFARCHPQTAASGDPVVAVAPVARAT